MSGDLSFHLFEGGMQREDLHLIGNQCLAHSGTVFFKIRRIGTLPPGCFWPPPKVESAMISIVPHEKPLIDDPEAFGDFLHRLFSRRRKQLGTIMGREALLPSGVVRTVRPEQLSVAELVEIHRLNARLDG